jgi:type IV fimbrial biogenesis protein FimT
MAVMRCLRGFTLIEVVVVMAVFAILLTIALPSMSQFVTDNRIKQAATDFDMTLLNARSNAMRMGVPVVVCASTGATSNNVPVVTHQLEFWLGVLHRLSAYRQPDCFRVLVVHGSIPSSCMSP